MSSHSEEVTDAASAAIVIIRAAIDGDHHPVKKMKIVHSVLDDSQAGDFRLVFPWISGQC